MLKLDRDSGVSMFYIEDRLPRREVKFLIERHLKLSAEYGRGEAFKPGAAKMVRSWIRGLLFENRPQDIHGLMDQFNELLTLRFKMIIRLLMILSKSIIIF